MAEFVPPRIKGNFYVLSMRCISDARTQEVYPKVSECYCCVVVPLVISVLFWYWLILSGEKVVKVKYTMTQIANISFLSALLISQCWLTDNRC